MEFVGEKRDENVTRRGSPASALNLGSEHVAFRVNCFSKTKMARSGLPLSKWDTDIRSLGKLSGFCSHLFDLRRRSKKEVISLCSVLSMSKWETDNVS